MAVLSKILEDEPDDLPELPMPVRINLAHEAWIKHGNTTSVRKIARAHGVVLSTLQARINGGLSRLEANQAMQRLTAGEEDALQDWMLELASWGWPVRPEQLRGMATELLHDKGDLEELGIHWTEQYLNRHLVLKTKYVAGLDKARAKAQDPVIIQDWFKLYRAIRLRYNITNDEYVFNMDEKGVMLGIIGKVKVIISRHEKKQYMTEPGNREWATLIKCILLKSGPCRPRPRPWIIFKGKQHMKQWFDAYDEAHISLSTKGWTDNTIGYEWFERCFEPQTRPDDKTKWRMLIVDGHASHVTTKAIKFCLAHKIILLCLPPHTTHILQPLDVGLFAPLSALYKKGVRERSRFSIDYSIDKVDFLEIYRSAREEAFRESNISKAWMAVGLEPFDPNVVLKQLPGYTLAMTRPQTPPTAAVSLAASGDTTQVPITPGNVAQVEDLF
jgi:hypothetical protein